MDSPPRRTSLVVTNPDPPSPASSSHSGSAQSDADRYIEPCPTPPTSESSWEKPRSPSPKESCIPQALQQISLEHCLLLDRNKSLIIASRRATIKAQRDHRQNRQLLARAQQAEHRTQEIQAESEQFSKQIIQLNEELESWKKEFDQSDDACHRWSDRCRILERELHEVKAEYMALAKTNLSVHADFDSMEDELQRATVEAQMAADQVIEARHETENVKGQCRAVLAKRDRDLAKLRVENDQLQSENVGLGVERERLQDIQKCLATQVVDLRSRLRGADQSRVWLKAGQQQGRVRLVLVGVLCGILMLGFLLVGCKLNEVAMNW